MCDLQAGEERAKNANLTPKKKRSFALAARTSPAFAN